MSQIALPLTRRGRDLARAAARLEFQFQAAVAAHLTYGLAPDWEFTAFPAGELRDKRTAAKLKYMGLKRGWPDLILVSPSGQFHGLELKREGGRLSPEQMRWHGDAMRRGWIVAVADNIDEALTILTNWGALRS